MFKFDRFGAPHAVSLGLVATIITYWVVRRLLRRSLVEGRSRKCVLITACDGGFGQLLALRLDSQGVPVFAGCATDTGVQRLRNQSSSSLLKPFLLDVRRDESVVGALVFVQNNLPADCHLWALVNNSSVPGTVGLPCEAYTAAHYAEVLDVNLCGMVRVTNACLPLLMTSRGRVVNTSCQAGHVALPGNPAYVASKFAVHGWTDALRREKARMNISVSEVVPGAFCAEAGLDDDVTRRMKELWLRTDAQLRRCYSVDYIERAMWAAKRSCGVMSPDVALIAHAHERALFSARPKSVYYVGSDALLAAVLQHLPNWILDRVVLWLMWNPAASFIGNASCR